MQLTFTFDLENHLPAGAGHRYTVPTMGVLDWLDEHGARATFFIVASLAKDDPGVVAEISSRGHECAVHGLSHLPLDELGPERLATDLVEAREIIEQAGGAPVTGFRAPTFSLTRDTPWAPEVIQAAGYEWSSSVLPARSPLYGMPGAPLVPFRWACGLAELPCPVGGVGNTRIPFLGGVYVRYVPIAWARRALKSMPGGAVPWTYLHPFDVDPDEPFAVHNRASWLTSRVLHARRGATLERIERLAGAAGGFGPPLGEVARALDPADLPELAL